MFEIYTGAIETEMVKLKTQWNLPLGPFVEKFMGEIMFRLEREPPVAVLILPSYPIPAGFVVPLHHITPKPDHHPFGATRGKNDVPSYRRL
jgi:hypothetical protein